MRIFIWSFISLLAMFVFCSDSLAAVYFQEDFEAVPAGELPWNCGIPEPSNVFFDSAYSLCAVSTPPSSAQVVAGEGHGGSIGGRFNYFPGGTLDGTMSNIGPTSGYEEVYVRAYLRFEENFPWGEASGLKLFRWYFGPKSVIPGFSTNVAPWDGKHKLSVAVDGYPVPGIPDGWALEDHDDGAWHLFEIRMRLNNPGLSDGLIQWWVDGQSVMDIDDWQGRETGDDSLMMTNGVMIGGNIPGGPEETASVWYDNFTVKDIYTGVDAEEDSIAPVAPLGLSVW